MSIFDFSEVMDLYAQDAKQLREKYTPALSFDIIGFNEAMEQLICNNDAQMQAYNVTPYVPGVCQKQCVPASAGGNVRISDQFSKCCGNLVDKDGKEIANFTVNILEHFEGTADEELLIEVLRTDGTTVRMKLSVEEFRAGNWYKKKMGLSCKDFVLFKQYLEQLCGTILHETTKTFPVAGWYKIDGRFDFVTSSGDCLCLFDKVEVQTDGIAIYPVRAKSEQELGRQFWDMRFLTNDNTAMIMMVYLILASLYTIFKEVGFTPKGVLAIIGPRSSRKTSLAMVIAKLYQRSAGMTPYLNFHSTPTSIDEVLQLFKDGVMIIDDLMPSEDKQQKRKLEATLEYVTRVFGDGISKKRSKKYSEECNPKGLALITGEYITGVSSSQSRRIVIKINEQTVNCDALTIYQENLDVVPGFLWNFLRYCALNQERLFRGIREEMIAGRNQYHGRFSVDRYADYQAQLETTAGVLFDYLQSIGVLDTNACQTEMMKFSVALSAILTENIVQQEEKNPFQQICKTLYVAAVENVGEFTELGGSERGTNYVDENFLYVYPEWLLKAVKAYTETQGMESAVDSIPYIKDVLKNAGALVCAQEGQKLRYTVRIPGYSKLGEKRRFLKIPKSKVIFEE